MIRVLLDVILRLEQHIASQSLLMQKMMEQNAEIMKSSGFKDPQTSSKRARKPSQETPPPDRDGQKKRRKPPPPLTIKTSVVEASSAASSPATTPGVINFGRDYNSPSSRLVATYDYVSRFRGAVASAEGGTTCRDRRF